MNASTSQAQSNTGFFEVQNIIKNIFQKIRKKPGSYYEEEYFMDYLLDPPAKPNCIKNSFKGTAKYYAFFRAVEMEFGICFPIKDSDKTYTLNTFTQTTLSRIDKHKGNKQIIQNRLNEKENYLVESVLTMILIIIFGLFGLGVISTVSIILFLIAMKWVVSSRLTEKKHNKALYKKIFQTKV